MLRTVFSLVVLVLLGYGGILIAFYLLQDRLLFLPAGVLQTTPAERGLEFEDVTLETSDGERLHGWWVPATPARAVLLFCHGNAGNISNRFESIELFHRLGLSVFIFDYRGYGASTGTPSEEGLYRDAEAAWRHLVAARGVRPEEIVLFGRSLGGAVAAALAEAHHPGALILEATFTSLPAVAVHHYPFLPAHLLARARFNTLRRVERLRVPLLVLHSPDDEIIPFDHGRRLYEAAAEPRTFVTLQGSHNDGFFATGRRYTDAIDGFLRSHLGR